MIHREIREIREIRELDVVRLWIHRRIGEPRRLWASIAVVACGVVSAPALLSQAPGVAAIERLFERPPDDARIMMRWWWFGPSVTRDGLDAEMRRMKEGGIGGFEVATVYPMALDDPARGLRNYPYLSPEYLDHVGFTARRARELGLRMDMTLGSGWSFGGPHITGPLQAMRLRSERREITPVITSVARPVPYENERFLAAFVGRGATREVDAASFRALDIAGTGPLALPPGAGPRTLLFYFSAPTGQVIKRAALGAEGYVLDHFNRAAIDTHLRETGDKLIAAAGPGAIHAIFCDSLEVYDADWTGDLFEEFHRRRGYDLRPLLPFLEYEVGERSRAVRRDVGRTQTELFEERFLVPVHEWSRRNNVRFRIQNYGAPPASLASHRHVDLMDGEGFEWRTLSRARWAASAAHLFRQPVAASETWTWIHSPAFRATPLDLKGEADLHFLSGINQLIGHGWPYSPPQAGSPGWPFYAAGVFSDKNPWWPVMPDLAAYLQRVSFLLRQGDPVVDVAIYAPTDDARSVMRPGAGDYLNLWMGIRDSIGPRIVPAILDAGYSFDLIDDGTLQEAASRRYKVILLPGVRMMPAGTERWLAEYIRGGGRVLALRRAPASDGLALTTVTDDNLGPRLRELVPADVTLTPPAPDIGFVHRQLPDADVYFVANTANVRRRVSAGFLARTPHAELWDPMTGAIERLRSTDQITLALEPYQSRVVVFRNSATAARLASVRTAAASEDLRAGWRVTVGDTPTSTPVDLPHEWSDNSAQRFFSGTARYERTVRAAAAFRAPGTRVFLDFGDATAIEREPLPNGTMRGNSYAALVAPPIREAATVFVNGRRAGALWAPPYRLDVTDYLSEGDNTIRIEVYNTAINQLAEGGRLLDVSAVVERYGQRFRLQDMEGLRPLPSGLLSTPRLVAER